jgi:hypothetical protein
MTDTEGMVLDSDSMMGIIPGAQGNGKCVQLTGVTGHTTSAEVADVVYPILTESKKTYVFATRGTTLVLSDTKDKIISLVVLLKAGFNVEFAVCTSDEPNFGGYLITPAGSHVALVFENNLWRVPLWTPPILAPARHTMPAKVLIKSGTTNFLPAPCSTQDLKGVSTIKPHAFATRGTTLVLTDTKDKIISLAILLKDDFKVDGFKVEFAAGTSDDLNFGGYLITPTGSRVALVFENNLWRVPLWTPPIRAPATHTMSAKVLIKSGTTNFLPAPCSIQDLKGVSTIKQEDSDRHVSAYPSGPH